MYVWLAVAMTAGGLLVLFSQHFRHAWMDPGTLTNAHATSATKCSDCHSVDPVSSTQLVSATLGSDIRQDSALCLKCHQMGDLPLRAHGLSAGALADIQRQLAPNERKPVPVLLRASHALALKHAQTDDLACATCHQEHHGRTFDLKRLTNAQCQACHATQFASFEKGHPKFASYPYQRRTRIFFDHASHLGQHFAEKKDLAPVGCQSCHAPGPAGQFMQVRNFNATCAACHAPQIKGEGMTTKGVAFFTVPGIDVETLAAHNISIGEWPKFADGKLTPFMELLLSRQPTMGPVLEKLRGVDLLDLTKATPEQMAAAEQFAWGVKTLLFHLIVEGQSYLIEEMKGVVAPAGLEMPRAALLAAQKEWMPQLLSEVAAYQKGIKPSVPAKPKPSPGASLPNEKPATGDESLLGGDNLAASTAKPTATPGNDLLAGGNDDLAAATPAPPSKASDDLSEAELLGANSEATPPPAAPPAPETMPAEEWVAAGGWYRPQESLTLFYRPIGHADPFLLAWLNAAAQLSSERATPEAEVAFRTLADPQSPGLCMKCHTVDDKAGSDVRELVACAA